MSILSPTPWPYRYRTLLFAFVYIAGWSLGNAVDALWRHAPAQAAYVIAGRIIPALGSRGALAIALVLTCSGFAVRVWGSSYLRARTVWSTQIETGVLFIAGPFRYTRNPLYLGTVVLSAGVGLLGSLPALALIVAGNFGLCACLARAEERSLLATYGPQYCAYARRVPRFFPTLDPAPRCSGAAPSLRAGIATELPISGFVLAMLDALATLRPGTPAFWLALLAGPLLAACIRRNHRPAS
ncbi:MAG: isoprenylcysteine carboxylmethyltransferase family protein [Candidatus Eremiobacteraeota bacterium]|nr:isoprenylcysteine carboxylmethyltransferase family protein [Candidatus Eremiobacteraeota bacterium]